MNQKAEDEIQGDYTDERNLFALIPDEELEEVTANQFHVLSKGIICLTDYRARPRSLTEIVLDATDGFIPVWAEDRVLHWRFNEASLSFFQQPESVKSAIRDLLREAITAWGDAAPIRFTENPDNSDFEIVVRRRASCTPQGCTLASAFFPDAGRHELVIYPTMFEQSPKEQLDTMVHEIGHIFGLRHFFAPELEPRWPSVIFGENRPFTIMNYGNNSELTRSDRDDLKRFYEGVWSGQLRKINRTPIKQFQPFHYLNA